MEKIFNFILSLILSTIMSSITFYGFMIGISKISLMMLSFSSIVLIAIMVSTFKQLKN